jgi:hypothetical protein
MMKKIIVGVVSIMLLGCTNGDGAVRSLEGAGYTNIKITGYRLTGCHDDDTFRTGFKATGPSGKPVTGVVCSGILKGSTIRTD